jgi:hypothetical protein
VLARESHRDAHLPRVRSGATRLRTIQRDRGRRRGLYRLLRTGQQRCVARSGIREHLRYADAEQELWPSSNQVRASPHHTSPHLFLILFQRRLGIAVAQPPLIQVLSNTKAPYNISTPTAHLALRALSPASLSTMRENIETLKGSRVKLLSSLHSLKELGLGRAIGAQDANFIMIPVLARGGSVPDSTRAQRVYLTLAEEEGVVVRYRGSEIGCQGCLRITVGTEEENAVALEKLRKTLENL